MTCRLILGDCIEAMAAMPNESVDAVVCDPPYGIEFMGKEWDSFRRDDPGTNRNRGERAGVHGEIVAVDERADRRSPVAVGGGKRASTFRCVGCGKRDQYRNSHSCPEGTEWRRELIDPHAAPPTMLAYQEWCRVWAQEALRILKPGGHLLAFGGTRTYHRLACGLEEAGFDIRDSLHWIYGSGFPKSLDVALAIDKRAGVEREEVGERPQVSTGSGRYNWNTSPEGTGRGETFAETVATSEEARQWDGWGTALKPAHEPIVLARKPLASTVAETVLEYGTGALNIAGARVGTAGGTASGTANDNWRPAGTNERPSVVDIESIDAGRFPANVLLAHLPDCKGSGPHHTETLCEPGCPVAELNAMSGESSSSLMPLSAPWVPSFGEDTNRTKETVRGHDDSGGAARFFYIAKPKTRERVGGTVRNLHPTVKPIELMRYLVRLVTPPAVPYCPACEVDCSNAIPPDSDGAVSPLRQDVRGGEPPEPSSEVLHQDLRVEMAGGDATGADGDDQGLRGDLSTGAPGIVEAGVHHGAPAGDGGCARTSPVAERGGSSPERKEGRQPFGEPGGHGEADARQASEAAAEVPLPPLRSADNRAEPSRCPKCHGPLSRRPGVVLDPFLGSGTTGCAAMAEGFDFVGIERDEDSFETAFQRVSDWAFAHGRDRPTRG